MAKYKICPTCSTQNPPTKFECVKCETDLTGVQSTDAVKEKSKKPSNASNSIDQILIKRCNCGKTNPANSRKCCSCGEDICDITPVPDKDLSCSYTLSSIEGTYAYTITEQETLIGREQKMSDYLVDKSFVSRIHCKLIIENGELYVENTSSTNHTFLNNMKVEGKAKLSDGDELALGGVLMNNHRQNNAAYFLVRIGSCI